MNKMMIDRKVAFLMVSCWVFSALPVGGTVHRPEPFWYHDYDLALKEAQAKRRPLLISFSGSDWCRPCIKLKKEVFETERFHEYAASHLVLLSLDFPRLRKNRLKEAQKTHNEQLAERYNPKGEFPLVVLIDADEQVISRTGYRTGGAKSFIDYLNPIINP